MLNFPQVLAANANRWLADGWGGDLYPVTRRSIRFVNLLLDASTAATSLKPLNEFAKSLPKPGTVTMKTYSSWYQFYADNIASEYTNSSTWGTIMSLA